MRRPAEFLAVVFAVASLSFVSCERSGGRPGVATPRRAPRLSICLRRGIGISGYEYAELQRRIQAQPPSACAVSFSERDVDAYRVEQPAAGRVEVVLTERASAGARRRSSPGQVADALCLEGPFVVALDGRELYVGQCYGRMGAAALRYPVMHIEEEEGRVLLRVGEVQGRWAGVRGDAATRRRMDPPALRALFESLGKLESLRE
jgi:hypothetical protein